MLVILLNCITLGMYQPCADELCVNTRCQILQLFDHLIFAFFAVEMAVRILAMGFVGGRNSYLSETWNRLDFFIVVAGAIEYCLDVGNMNLSAIRTIRVLRPLRAINRIPSMRILVMLLLDTLPMLGNVLMLCFFVFFIFGIVGVQLWAGLLRQRCYLPTTFPLNEEQLYEKFKVKNYYTIGQTEHDKDYICSTENNNGIHRCDMLPQRIFEDVLCNGSPARSLNDSWCINWNQYYTNCSAGDRNPFQGAISFDNIGLAWVAIFLVISLEGWSDIMYYVQDAHSFWDWIYFVLLIVIGSFFMINLCLVVIATQFSETKKREMERMRQERERAGSSSTLSMSEGADCYTQIIKYLNHLARRTKRVIKRWYRRRRRQRKIKKKRKENELKDINEDPEGEDQSHLADKHGHRCHSETQKLESILHKEANIVTTTATTTSTYTSTLTRKGSPKDYEKRSPVKDDANASSQHLLLSQSRNCTCPFPCGACSQQMQATPPTKSTSTVIQFSVSRCGDALPSISATVDSRDSSQHQEQQRFQKERQQIGPEVVFDFACLPQEVQATSNSCTLTELQCLDSDSESRAQVEPFTAGGVCAVATTQPEPRLETTESTAPPLLDSIYTAASSVPCQPEAARATVLVSKSTCTSTNSTNDVISIVSSCQAVSNNSRLLSTTSLKANVGSTSPCSGESDPNDKRITQTKCPLLEGEQSTTFTSESHTPEQSPPSPTSQPVPQQPQQQQQYILSQPPTPSQQRASIVIPPPAGPPSTCDGTSTSINTPAESMAGSKAAPQSSSLLYREDVDVSSDVQLQHLATTNSPTSATSTATSTAGSIPCSTAVVVSEIHHRIHYQREQPQQHRNQVLRAADSGVELELDHHIGPPSLEDDTAYLCLGIGGSPTPLAIEIAAHPPQGLKDINVFNEGDDDTLDSCSTCSSCSSECDCSDEECDERRRRRRKKNRKPGKFAQACSRFRTNIKILVDHPRFQRGILAAILVNTLSMGIEYHQQPAELTLAVELSNILFTAVFGLEMVLKILAEGFGKYIQSGFNVFDGVIVVLSSAELLNQSEGSGLSVLRTFRLLRILKLVRFMPALRRQLFIMLRTMDNVAVFFALLMLFIFIFSILGMNLFGGKFCTVDALTGQRICDRKNFDTLLWALVTVFQILTQEDWNIVLFNGMEKTSPWAALYFVALMTFGNYVLFNLLVAILVEGFAAEGERKRTMEALANAENQQKLIEETNIDTKILEEEEMQKNNIYRDRRLQCPIITRTAATPQGSPNTTCVELPLMTLTTESIDSIDRSLNADLEGGIGGQDIHMKVIGNTGKVIAFTQPPQLPDTPLPKLFGLFEPRWCFRNKEDYALFMFSPTNSIRVLCTKFSDSKSFDYAILVFIAANCITLAMERPNIPPGSLERHILAAANYTFTVVFAFEMLVKVIAKGLWYGPHAYLKSGWNKMDGMLVSISLIDFMLTIVADGGPRIFGILRVFRLLRSLRPLRVINRAPGLKLVVQTLMSSLRPIGNIVLICCTFFIIFGILGVQLFKGSFYYCEGPDVKDVKSKADCGAKPGYQWVNRKYNFDNLGQALMALFVLSSKDGWVDIMYSGLDAVGEDLQPIENFNEWRLLYFISFLLLVAFFVLNMFVGVVVENFHRCREEQEREERAQRAAERARKLEKRRRLLREPPYYASYSKTRLFTHNMVTSKYFDLAIAAVIGLNVVTMALEFYQMPLELEYALKIFNYFFTAVFILELAMKVIALGVPRYLMDRWNQLDVAIVILSIMGIVLEEMKSGFIPINPTIIRVMRVLRIARVLKLLKMADGMRALLDTVMQALPQVGNLGLLFFLLFFIFAALGVELFGRLECNDEFPCQGLGEHAHFHNFGMAFLTLFRVATGDNWNGIMKDTLRDKCDSSSDCVRNCCVSPVIAPLYFVIFVLMAQFVLVNVVVAVLMKHLEESHKQQDDDLEMEAELLEEELERQMAAAAAAARHQQHAFQHRPIIKMSSLPSNFVFYFTSDHSATATSNNLNNSINNNNNMNNNNIANNNNANSNVHTTQAQINTNSTNESTRYLDRFNLSSNVEKADPANPSPGSSPEDPYDNIPSPGPDEDSQQLFDDDDDTNMIVSARDDQAIVASFADLSACGEESWTDLFNSDASCWSSTR
ncbi:voltage-dependent T-type calcium channel subunit alpha-1H [Galendromus occidentalis]|uniref:Voltage-dependent T-type calcium channel subunit alpha-1H n=1 Tax=Galendromus occidentalis TaxID=34638 RepID=A0AAJ7P9A5_9ACAR|nr:voltage-dependent T-type calcium channel subunit alpha-1H [Galendromus occidentalis]